MQILEILNQAKNIADEHGQFKDDELVGFLNKGIAEMNGMLSVNFPLVKQPYSLKLVDKIQEISIELPTYGIVYPYAKFGDDLQFNIMVSYVAYCMLLSKQDEYAMMYKNTFDTFVNNLTSNFEFDYTNKYKSKVRRLYPKPQFYL